MIPNRRKQHWTCWDFWVSGDDLATTADGVARGHLPNSQHIQESPTGSCVF